MRAKKHKLAAKAAKQKADMIKAKKAHKLAIYNIMKGYQAGVAAMKIKNALNVAKFKAAKKKAMKAFAKRVTSNKVKALLANRVISGQERVNKKHAKAAMNQINKRAANETAAKAAKAAEIKTKRGKESNAKKNKAAEADRK